MAIFEENLQIFCFSRTGQNNRLTLGGQIAKKGANAFFGKNRKGKDFSLDKIFQNLAYDGGGIFRCQYNLSGIVDTR